LHVGGRVGSLHCQVPLRQLAGSPQAVVGHVYTQLPAAHTRSRPEGSRPQLVPLVGSLMHTGPVAQLVMRLR
jgi:hypothetical protein